MQKKLLLSLIFSFFAAFAVFLAIPGSSYAAEQSSVKINFSADYTVDSKNTVTAVINIRLTNKGRNPTILTYYDLRLGDVRPENINVEMNGRPLGFDIVESRGSVIRIKFGETLLRVNHDYNAKISYNIKNFLFSKGGGYDVVLPIFRLSGQTTADYVNLSYPVTFGPVNFSNSKLSSSEAGGIRHLRFDSASNVEYIFISIGQKRDFAFSFEKKLTNSQNIYSVQSVVLPPDTDTQHILISSITPLPDDVYRSDEGNVILNFNVPPKKDVWVRTSGYLISLFPKEQNLALATHNSAIWLDTSSTLVNISDSTIINEIKGAESLGSTNEKVSWIYNYVLGKLSLSANFRDLHKIDYRKGANVSLKTYKNASSEDYADAFVAVARHLGIPARLVAGYVYPFDISNKSLGMYHVWPQYWNSQLGWVSVDPAYEAYTGLDQVTSVGLNRIILAISPDSLTSVSFPETSDSYFFTGETIFESASMDSSLSVEKSVESGITQNGKILITNTGNTLLYNVDYVSSDSAFDLVESTGTKKTVIIPGQQVSLPFNFKVHSWYVYGSKQLKFDLVAQSAAEETLRKALKTDVNVVPLQWVQPVIWMLTIIAFCLVTGLFYLLFRFFRTIFVKAKLRSLTS